MHHEGVLPLPVILERGVVGVEGETIELDHEFEPLEPDVRSPPDVTQPRLDVGAPAADAGPVEQLV